MNKTARLEQARRRMKLAREADQKQRDQEAEDLAFQTPEGQWEESVKQARGKDIVQGVPIPPRPMLSVAPVDEPIQLVANQARAAHLAAAFHPLSIDANDDTATVLQGLYDQCCNESRADQARFWAYDRALWCGRGVYRINKAHDPEGGHPFDQKLVLERVLYQDAYYRDPSAVQQDRSDAMWAFVVEALPVERYDSKYPKSKLAKFTNEGLVELATEYPGWFDGEEELRRIVVAEYWRVVVTTKTWRLYDDGQVYLDGDENIPTDARVLEGEDAQSRDEEVRRVFWSKINCQEELEPEQEWDGQYIPLIEVIGRELIPVGGVRRWAGMITNAKDSARLVNYAASGAVEMAALEPKAPFQWDPRQIAGFEAFWHQSNTRNFPGLPYNAVIDGQPMPPPPRVQVDVSRLGPNMQILSMGGQMLQSSMSTFDPALGKQPTAHRSGRALEALQGQTVEANSHYLSNLANISLMQEAKVWLDLAPHVYDRPERVVRILNGKGKSELVMLGMPYTQGQDGKPQATPTDQPVPADAKHFDLNKGRYGIAVTIGKSNASLLQQGNDALTQIIQAEPAVLPVIGPLWAKTLDVPFHDELSDLLQRDRDHRMPWLKDPNTPQDPQALAAENQALKGALQQATQALQSKVAEIQAKGAIDMQKTAGQEAAETQRNRENNETKLAVAELGAKVDRMALFLDERARLGVQDHEAQQAALDRRHDMAVGAADHHATTVEADQAHAQAMQQAEQGNLHAQEQAATDAALQPPADDGA